MERDYDTPEGKEAADDEAYMMPMEQRDPMMWDANMQICKDTLSFMSNLCCQKAFRIIQKLQQNFWTWVWSLLGPMCVGKVWDPVQNQLFSLPLCQYGEVIQWCELIKGNDEMPWMPGAVLFIYRYFLDRVPRHMGGGGYSPRLDKYYHFCILFS